jgi:chemotaxis signal transduction protein
VTSARALLRARAERYAAVAAQESHVLYSVVTFRRGEGAYALPLTGLCEIRPLVRWCTLPGTNPVVLGLVYYRGELLSLHDLAVFASGKPSSSAPSWVLVAEHHGARIGLVADDVLDVVEIESGAARAIPVTLGDASELFAGMLDQNSGAAVLIVDIARMFETQRFTSAF